MQPLCSTFSDPSLKNPVLVTKALFYTATALSDYDVIMCVYCK